MNIKALVILIRLVFFCLYFFICCKSSAQQLSAKIIADSVIALNQSNLSQTQKLKTLYYLKTEFEKNKFTFDSTYAKILHVIGVYEYLVNKNLNKAIAYTQASVKINTSKANNCSPQSAVRSYYYLAHYFRTINLFTRSLQYCDSTINFATAITNISSNNSDVLAAKEIMLYIYFLKGDYDRCLEESTIAISDAIKIKDSLHILNFMNQRAQVYFVQDKLRQALIEVEAVITFAKKINETYELAAAYKTKGSILNLEDSFSLAKNNFELALLQRIKTNQNGQIAGDYNDFGNFYTGSKDYNRARICYFKGIEYAEKNRDSLRLARINANLGNVYFLESQYEKAQTFYITAFNYLKLNSLNFFANPSFKKIDLIGDKELLIYLFKCKTELLLKQYCFNNTKSYLNACLTAALTTDSIINETRHEQLGEQSKLYWRNNTRGFYCNALEACYLANDTKLAFFFMEKSRAVLLNDRLNELGASAHLPANEAEKEDSLRSNIVQQEQQLADLKEGTKTYINQYLKLLNAKGDFENYIRSLEQKFPIYYQYKYNDQVPDLKTLQQFLDTNNQAFVHYFINDSVIYILGITANNTKLIKVSKTSFNITKLSTFLKMCADNQALNAHYQDFAILSSSIYSALFQPLQIQQKRVVICADNFLIPFGALCTDNSGKHFLVQDHAFSYAYSARSLLKPFNNPSPKGDLLGVAPVSFAPYLHLPTLKKSAESLKKSSTAFNNVKLLLNDDATKYSFMKLLPQYSVVNVFSHASADSANEEPLLFMADSMIHLSELQTIKPPATQLVVLSACQTNVGKLATGEGIYSLARGFASSGIPSVAATLWKADEDAIYEITQSFDYNLAHGMHKDVALQQAELAFITQHGDDRRKQLPYFWANMVLVGNAEPVKLSSPHHWGLIVSVTGIMLLIVTLVAIKRRRLNLEKN